MGDDAATTFDGQALIRAFLEHSPFAGVLGLDVRSMGEGVAELAMGYEEKLTTDGQVTHGGAISALIDTAGTAAAWATTFDEAPTRWGTASLTVNYLRPAKGGELVARAEVVRRGRQLCHCTIEVRDGENLAATGTMLYALS